MWKLDLVSRPWRAHGVPSLVVLSGSQPMRPAAPKRSAQALVLVALSLGLLGPMTRAQAAQAVLNWGDNSYGAVGDGTTTQRLLPVDITNKGALNGKTVTRLVGGFYHNMALCSDGTVASWGNNEGGQLGDGTLVSSSLPIDITAKGALSGKTVTQLTGGIYHSLALCSDGTLVSWGYNIYGQIGNGTTTDSPLPIDISGQGALSGKTVVQIASGAYHNLALCSDGTLVAWGWDAYGQLGDGTNVNNPVPIDITNKGALNGKTVTKIYSLGYFNLVQCSDGTLATWGVNSQGQLGNGTFTDSNLPVDITGNGALAGKTVAQFQVGGHHTLALCTDGTLIVWGNNNFSQIGDGTGNQQPLPIDITGRGALSGKTVTQIATGYYHNIVRCSDGTVVSWGYNSGGQLGDGTVTSRTSPVNITGNGALSGKKVEQVFGGGYASNLILATVLAAPIVTTGDASTITGKSATLGATVDPSGLVTTAKIEYGPDTNYGKEASLTLMPNDGGLPQNVSAVVTSLTPHTTYHYRVSATNDRGTVVGEDKTFVPNTAPSDITLSRNWVQEKLPVASFVGLLSSNDSDARETFTYSLVGGDTSAFAIDGAYLRTNVVLDEATQNSYNLTIRTTDSGGLSYDKAFTITVVETGKPEVSISSPTVNQKVLIGALTGDIVSGTATDNKGVVAVKVRLARKRGVANEYWDGTGFGATQAWLSATLSPSINGVDNSAVTWTLSGQLPSEGKLDVGAYAVQVYALDGANNKSAYANSTFTIQKDVTAPTLSITTPTLSQKLLIENFNGSAVSGTVNDGLGVVAVKVRLSRKRGTTNEYWNGTDFVTASSTVDATVDGTSWSLGAKTPGEEKLDNGAYQVEAYAIDGSGNKSATAKVSFSLSADYSAPSVTISTPTASQVIKINEFGTGKITGTASDNIGITSVKLKLQRKRGTLITYWNGTSFTETTATFDATYNSETGAWSYDSAIPASALDAGGYTLYATAYDGAGNKTTSPSRVFSIVGTASATGTVTTADSSANGS